MELSKKTEVVGIGMGLPGMVSLIKPRFTIRPISLFRQGECRRRSTSHTQLPVKLKMMLILPHSVRLFWRGKGHNNFIMLTLGNRVGGGIIINRQLFKGSQGMAGELGHIILDYQGLFKQYIFEAPLKPTFRPALLSRFAMDMITQHPNTFLSEI